MTSTKGLPVGLPVCSVDIASPTVTSPCDPLPSSEIGNVLATYYSSLFVLPNWNENAKYYNDILYLARQHRTYPPELCNVCEKCALFFAFMMEHDLCDIHYKAKGNYPDPPCASCNLAGWKHQFERELASRDVAQCNDFTFPTKYGVSVERHNIDFAEAFTLPTKNGVRLT